MASQGPLYLEKRSIVDSRYPVQVDATVVMRDSTSFSVEVKNLSRRGFGMRCSEPVTEGDEIDIAIDGIASRSAIIAWSHGTLAGGKFRQPLTSRELSQVGKLEIHPSDPEIGQFLRRIRLFSGVTQAHVAEAIGTSRETIWAWEAGKARPSSSKVFRLLAYLQSLQPRETDDVAAHSLPPSDIEGPAHSPLEVNELLARLQQAVAARLGVEIAAVDIQIRISGTPLRPDKPSTS